MRKGKINLEPRRLAVVADQSGLRSLAINRESIFLSCELRQSHTDPFDCLLYGQAKKEEMRLLTIDRTLSSFGAVIHRF